MSVFAAATYGIVALSCLAAAWAAHSERQRLVHVFGWAAIAVFFTLLIYLRINTVEELLRDDLRASLRASGGYEGRRSFQMPIAVGIILAASAALIWPALEWRGARGRRDKAFALAKLGFVAMIGLIVMRTVSFSVLDNILFGPLKLNWIGDIGSSLLVLGAATYYVRVVRQMLPPRSKPKRGEPRS